MKYLLLISLIIIINSKFLSDDLLDIFLDTLHKPVPHYATNPNFNITDMTINSLFYILDKNEFKYTIKNQTGLPITIDSKGLSQIIPELNEKFLENTELAVTVYKVEKHDAPIIDTSLTGTLLSFEFGLDINLGEELLVTSTLSGHIKLQLYTSDNKLNVFISNLVIDNIKEVGGSLPINSEVYKGNMNMVIKVALNQMKDKLKNIDLLTPINQKLKKEFTGISITQNKGYNTITLN